MKLANTSKRVLPWFAVIIFLIVPILMMMNLLRPHLFDPEFVWIDYSYFLLITLSYKINK
jgi:hypothetical protein